eukprot:CAMPEP_0174914324 /NCGR_PEP_ID=MMETSP0167-20121228/80778_1 /TAXON_ID=38298 /ORGANISM="Rhodella maculata, Strain CCMP736" /LENGTH=145 /DNA_ID=CAMNT_0016159077 /DNA_START=57 /DNA_END=494 /DNA_ORIENTATION=+
MNDSWQSIGMLHAHDPFTGSVIIWDQPEDGEEDQTIRVRVLFGSAIRTVEPCATWNASKYPSLDIDESLEKLSQNESCSIEADEVRRLLSKSSISYLEREGVFHIYDCIRIQPPYSPSCCKGTNETALIRIRDALSSIQQKRIND